MKPLSLKLSHFQSHTDTVLELSGIECAVLSGPNGAGKSSLLDAILFALFGEARGGNLDSVVMHGEEVARVEYQFGLNGSTYLVSRQRSTKGAGSTTLSFQCDGQVLDGKTVAETQRRIEETTHLTAELLRATAVSAQGDADAFSRAKPAERKGYLGDIVGTEHFDELAQVTRDTQKGVQASRDAKATALEVAQVTVATIPTITSSFFEVAEQIKVLESDRTAASEAIEHFGAAREETVRAQAADGAARKELTDLRSRQTVLVTDEDRAKVRVENLAFTTRGVADTLAAIQNAEAAQQEAAVAESRRQERDRLRSEATVLAERVKGAKASHNDGIRALETEIATARKDHERDRYSLGIEIDALATREKLLSDVPCADTPMAERCPLIEDAMGARTLLPSKRQALEALEAQTPWTEQEKRLDALRAEEPWRADATELARLKTAYDAIEYDAEAHTKAKADAGKLPDLQKSLSTIEAAQAQIPEAQQALEKTRAELKQVGDRVTALETELGQERDWASELADIDRRLVEAKDTHARLGRSLDVARQSQGALTERLNAAQAAAEQVKALETEIADLDRRINILKILGNPRDGAFSKGGIPALLIEQAVPELEAAANEVLATLSDGRMALELRTQKEASSGKGMSETLDIIVLDEIGERLYESYSGGERMRVDLALRVGLSKLLAHRADARCQLMVLDETAAPLDARGQEQFVEALARIATEEELTVLCVSHLEGLKDQFPVRIEVSKDGDGSRVEVVR